MTDISIPQELLPADGRFGSGPSKVRQGQLDYVNAHSELLGTSHRQKPIKNIVAGIQEKMATLFALPSDYEVLLTNGGASLMWDAASFSIVKNKAAHGVYGEFSSRFAAITNKAPHLAESKIVEAEPGTAAYLEEADDVDTYCLTHNETSTGVMVTPYRVGSGDSVVMVDATSGAGSCAVDPSAYDMYYFSPQKCFGADGGVVFALCSPKMIERIESVDRFAPAILDLKTTVENSRLNQTLNTPSLVTLFLVDAQLDWLLENGGMEFANKRCADSSSQLFNWAEAHEKASPFVQNEQERSLVTATIDLDSSIDAEEVVAALRSNGVVDCDPYRKLGRNQIRIATFPSIEPDDVAQLIKCLDYVIERVA
jgi:phosphoserine aminotransferase